jgi:hypothetical protein
MALFNDKKGETQEQVTPQQEAGNQSYFDSVAGDGLEGFTPDTMSTQYLGMVQPGSGPTLNGHLPGTWRNSATEENFDTLVEVVVMAFKTVWTERASVHPYHTVGQYQPKSIDVKIEYPKPGQRGFPKMTNPITGNKVEELFIYACTLKDRPENGIMFFSPTVGSMKTCKAWNASLRSQRLPSGMIAPIYAFPWTLELELVPNPAKPAEQITRFVRFKRGELINEELFVKAFRPQLIASKDVQMIAAPETSGDIEE